MILDILRQSPLALQSLCLLLGLMVGSFLNVVIYRLPVMMQRNWRQECRQFLQLPADEDAAKFDLTWPGSRCPACEAPIKGYQNIPIVSYLMLRGRCANCSATISPRYPLIEAFTGLCSLLVAWQFGFGAPLLFALLMTWGLIALSFIDIDHQLLPDSITLPGLWLGLLLSLFEVFTDSHASIIGAAAGYLSLWSVYWIFKLLTGKDGMGFGDFKLLALFGAWLGWQYLPMIILLSSLVGAVVGVALILARHHQASQPIPFGPYLAAAGWLALLWGKQINHLYLSVVGL